PFLSLTLAHPVRSARAHRAVTLITIPMGTPLSKSIANGDTSARDRKSTRLNSSHVKISYAVFCLKKKKNIMIKHLCHTQIHHYLIHTLSRPSLYLTRFLFTTLHLPPSSTLFPYTTLFRSALPITHARTSSQKRQGAQGCYSHHDSHGNSIIQIHSQRRHLRP